MYYLTARIKPRLLHLHSPSLPMIRSGIRSSRGRAGGPLHMVRKNILLTRHIFSPHAYGIFQACLGSKLECLLCCGRTTDNGLVAVEVFCDFLKGSVACFDVEEVDDCELHGEPDAVEDVVFPAEVVEGDGVDVLVEEDWVG
jgi:hypothetical protein